MLPLFIYKAYASIAKPIFANIPYKAPEVFEGDKGLKSCLELLNTQGVKRPVLISDKMIVELGLSDNLQKELKDLGMELEIFDSVEPDPSYETVQAGITICNNHNFDALIALGGGSVLDAAKVINVGATFNKKPSQLIGMFKVLKRGKPFVAIPTTAGTGSEMTVVSVLTDRSKNSKETVIAPAILPSYAVLIPELLQGLPAVPTGLTGIDALSHAMEAYMSKYALESTDKDAEDATKIIFSNLQQSFDIPQDLGYREQMLKASSLAGRAFTRTSVGYVHALAHQLGAIYHEPHGKMIGLVLHDVLKLYGQSIHRRLARLAILIGVGKENQSESDLSEAYLEALNKLAEGVKIPRTLNKLKKEDIPEIVRRAQMEVYTKPYGVPVYFSNEQLSQLLETYLEN